jgi:hypothetical protein
LDSALGLQLGLQSIGKAQEQGFWVHTQKGSIIVEHSPGLDRGRQPFQVTGLQSLQIVLAQVGMALDVFQGQTEQLSLAQERLPNFVKDRFGRF